MRKRKEKKKKKGSLFLQQAITRRSRLYNASPFCPRLRAACRRTSSPRHLRLCHRALLFDDRTTATSSPSIAVLFPMSSEHPMPTIAAFATRDLQQPIAMITSSTSVAVKTSSTSARDLLARRRCWSANQLPCLPLLDTRATISDANATFACC